MEYIDNKGYENLYEMTVEELNDSYLIKFIGINNSEKVVSFHKDEKVGTKIYECIKMFLNFGNINGVSKFVPIVHNVSKFKEYSAEVFIANNSKKLSMKIYDPKMRFISKNINDRYFYERECFFKNENISEIRIDAIPDVSKFEVCNDVVNLTLNTDTNANILRNEREFIRDLLEYKCARRKIDVLDIDNKLDGGEWVCTCGEFKIIFPRKYTFSTIIGMIREHNFNIDEMRKRR